jgi:8-oxo-dGTP diphosphatase
MSKLPLRLVGTLGYLVRDGKLLLLHRSRPPNFELWSPPGGKAEIGESPEECLRREFLEETGLVCGELELAGILTQFCSGHYDLVMFLFRILDAEGEFTEGDGGPLDWVPLEKIYDLPIPPADRLFGPRVLDPAMGFFRAKFVQTPEGEVLQQSWHEVTER